MPRRYLSPDELAGAPGQGDAIASSGRAFETLPDRCVRYSFSDATVGRDMHTIQPDAWDLTNFERNPVFLWAHCDDELPVGRVEDLTTQAGRLTGLVRYAEHPVADTVYQLVKGAFLNATSTGWLPLEWKAANDRKRPGGLDFTRVELLEISQVPVPALPTALVTARKAGVDTRPLYDWAERLLDHGDFAVIPRPDLEALRKAARMPKSAARSKTPPAEPKADVPATQTAPAEPTPPTASARDFDALARSLKKRDLFSLASFCYFLAGIENLYDSVAEEAAREEDGSDLPAKLRAWIDDGNRILLEMAGEETAEQIEGTQDDGPSSYYWSAAGLEAALARALDARGLTRKGAKHSAETLRCLRAVRDHVGQAQDQLSTLLDGPDADPETDANNPGDPESADDSARKAKIAERKARAEALKARTA